MRKFIFILAVTSAVLSSIQLSIHASDIPGDVPAGPYFEPPDAVLTVHDGKALGNVIFQATQSVTLQNFRSDGKDLTLKIIAPSISFAAASSSGSESVTSVNLSVNLTGPTNITVQANYAVSGGSASGGGVDYTLASGMLSFAPGETSKTITFVSV